MMNWSPSFGRGSVLSVSLVWGWMLRRNECKDCKVGFCLGFFFLSQSEATDGSNRMTRQLPV